MNFTTTAHKAVTLDVNPDGIPEDLKQYDQFVNWCRKKRDGEFTKVPYTPGTSRRAKSDDSTTWGSFKEALAALETRRYAGIGFMFSSGDPFCGIDLDDVYDPSSGEVSREAQRIIDMLDGYTEVSPSARGVHIIVRGKIERGRKRGWIEAYCSGRFFTLTGWPL